MSEELIVRQHACGELDFKAKVERLAAHIRHKGTAKPNSSPGVCQVCGHNTEMVYRVVFMHDTAGTVAMTEIPHNDARIAKIEERIVAKHRTDDSWSFSQSTMPFAVHTCEAISDEEVWKEAKRFNAAIAAARASNHSDPIYEPPADRVEAPPASELF